MKEIDLFKARFFNTKDLLELQIYTASKGNQRKWYDVNARIYVKEQFYYQEHYWKDYLVELIAVALSKQMNLHGVKVVEQKECEICNNSKITYGVYSADFTLEGERYVGIAKLNQDLVDKFISVKEVKDRFKVLVDEIYKVTKLDLTEYFIVMSLLDYLVGNEDRHLNNMGVIIADSKFKIAPLFDFGLGLFEHDERYFSEPFSQCLLLMKSQPFSLNNQDVIDYLSTIRNLNDYLPSMFNLTSVKMPSLKAGSYVRNRCMKLGIELEGLEDEV